MGDDKDPSASSGSETVPVSVSPPSILPRPVSVVPRPLGGAPPTSRMPPPPSSRGVLPGSISPGPLRSPPPPPLRSALLAASPAPVAPSGPVTSAAPLAPTHLGPVTSATPLAPVSAVAASPSVMPRAPATPPPPPQRHLAPPSFSRPLTQPPSAGATAQLEQRVGATQVELRKLSSERHTLRARLRREADRLHELESALRAEKELRRHASDEHYAALSGLRTRLTEVEAERDKERAGSDAALQQANAELDQSRNQLDQARSELEQLRAELEQSRWRAAVTATPAVATPAKAMQGLRRIRGIGPAYQRLLERLGIERVQQVAAWTDADVISFADKLKIRPDRITKDDWIGQARMLDADPVE